MEYRLRRERSAHVTEIRSGPPEAGKGSTRRQLGLRWKTDPSDTAESSSLCSDTKPNPMLGLTWSVHEGEEGENGNNSTAILIAHT
ncbi:hypothetical protein P5V15_002411 [Pogonomyrmex californicus]